jgi:hypothetical protein
MKTFKCSTLEEAKATKDKIMMLRIICLDEWNENPLMDMTGLSKRKKDKLANEILNKWEMPMKEITELFNKIVCEDILDVATCDIEKLPCYEVGKPELPEDYKEMLRAEGQLLEA